MIIFNFQNLLFTTTANSLNLINMTYTFNKFYPSLDLLNS